MKRPVGRAPSRYIEDMKERRVVGVPTVHERDPVHNLPENVEKALVMLKDALGEEWATDDPAIACGYARDQSYTPATYPHLVCLPASTDEVVEVYRIANECLVDVMPYGTGISTMGATIPLYGGMICDLRRMDRIIELDARNMYARIEPGVNFCELQAEAQKVGLRVTNPSTSATAGVISNHMVCNINTMSCKYGFGLDNVIETMMVLPDGEVLEAGPRACGMVPAHVQGPGPDVAPLFRYNSGVYGIVTELTIRLYPEPAFSRRFYPTYSQDRLDDIVEALYRISRDNLAIELAHLQDTFYGIICSDNNREAESLASMMPRNNILSVFGGATEEEARVKRDITRRRIQDVSDVFGFLEQEQMDEIMADRMKPDRSLKYMRESVRVQRVRGSFLIGALIDHLGNFLESEAKMRQVTTDQIGTTDGVFRPDDASGYFQPYHMGRVAYMEYDLYTNQSDRDDLVRELLGYFRASFAGMGNGALFAAGASMLLKGLPYMDMAIPMMMPRLAPYMEVFTALKREIDPNNISNRRWDYDTGLMSKLSLI